MLESPVIRRLRGADDPAFGQICDLWHRIWYAKSDAADHLRYRTELLHGPWGCDHAHIHVLEEGGHVVSGLVVFLLDARLMGEAKRVAGIALVATDPAARGRGLARRLLDAVHDELRREGPDLGLLFSDIDPAYYEKMGYETWPVEAHRIARPPEEGGDLRVRDVQEGDQPLLVDLHARHIATWDFAIERDAVYWRHLLTREERRLAMGAAPPTRRLLAFQGDHAVAHAAFTLHPGGMVVDDLAWLPGHARAIRRLMTGAADRHGVVELELTCPPAMLERLELVPLASERLDKMMLTRLDTREPRGLSPRSHPLLRTDAF